MFLTHLRLILNLHRPPDRKQRTSSLHPLGDSTGAVQVHELEDGYEGEVFGFDEGEEGGEAVFAFVRCVWEVVLVSVK